MRGTGNNGFRSGGIEATGNGARRRYARLPDVVPAVGEPRPVDGRESFQVSVGDVRLFDLEIDRGNGAVYLRNRDNRLLPLEVSVATPPHLTDAYVLVYTSFKTLMVLAYMS